MERAVFKPKGAETGTMINGFRIPPDVHGELKRIAHMNNLPLQELIRQMIRFALEHMTHD